MSILHLQETEVLLDRLISETTDLSGQESDLFNQFVRHYYYSVPYDNLVERDLFDLRGAALAHWQLGKRRSEGETKIRFYKPEVQRYGWRSNQYVLEVVTGDKPFLVDSVAMAIKRFGLKIHLSVHPVLSLHRDRNGVVTGIGSALRKGYDHSGLESYLHYQFDDPNDEKKLKEVSAEVSNVIDDIETAVADWTKIRQRMKDAAKNLERERKRRNNGDLRDEPEFCDWLEAGHFSLLGYCEFKCSKSGSVKFDPKSTLGILRNMEDIHSILPRPNVEFLECVQSLLITKASILSKIQRQTFMDLILIPKFGSTGNCIGVRMIIGVFASTAYNNSASLIPFIRQKLDRVFERSKLSETTHSVRVLTHIMDNYPREILFQATDNALFEDVVGILEQQDRQGVKIFLQREQYGRFYSAIVYIPREVFNRDLRIKIENLLMESLLGTSSEFNLTFSEAEFARINYVIYTDPSSKPIRTAAQIQSLVEDAAINWTESFRKATVERFGEHLGEQYFTEFEDAFSAGYQEHNSPWVAAAELNHFISLSEDSPIRVTFYRPLSDSNRKRARLKLFSYKDQISPSDALPVLENLGLRVIEERPHEVRLLSGAGLWGHEFILEHSEGLDLEPDKNAEQFEDALVHIWLGEAENDTFNKLVLAANLSWRQVVVLRAYSRFLKQIGFSYSETYITKTLTKYVDMSALLVQLFELKFDIHREPSDNEMNSLIESFIEKLDEVTSLDDDLILGSFKNAITSTIRTNYYRVDEDGNPLKYLSFKFDCSRISKMPDPRPKFEIFVYSTHVEAVHLRGGKVARGGLRWSDRFEDFRTEVLGLVKAQMVKNAVIVPVGSKGGFIVKKDPAPGQTYLDEGIFCYKTFMRGLLDITDNIVDNEIVRPPNVRCYDDVDPYLVVAADKGTATFSDIANGIAEEYGFWLGDAFASGGSVGYDHKGMGITAKGGWESVKRHFREMGINIQTTDFTVIGIGDMGGDVFGNGMLLSHHIKLLSAFNHIEIFVDPNPDAATSFKERKRLFDTPGTTWKDYDPELISKGGGVFSRSAKAIEISPEMQKVFNISASQLTPNDLMNAMLKAPVDLLWNGGIGTYVKSSEESHADAANRSNDTIRVDGKELGARVVGEGGNLGMTQLGRVEYSMHGGRCYTDFIDNSGGVDCSDHEVNIKILLNLVVNIGEMTRTQRARLLKDMTETVSDLVINDNYQQTQALSVLNANASSLLREHSRYIQELVAAGSLDRELEFLPSRTEIKRRQSENIGLKLPELSVLLAYSKMTLYDELIESDLPEDKTLIYEMNQYFPTVLSLNFPAEMLNHTLKREIIATFVTNSMVNRVGPTFAMRMKEFTGVEYTDVARAFAAARQIFGLDKVWKSVESLDNKVAAQTQIQLLSYVGGLLERATLWLLRHRKCPLDIQATVHYFKEDVEKLARALPKTLTSQHSEPVERHIDALIQQDVPKKLAQQIVHFIPLSSSLDIVEIIKETGKSVDYVARIYYDVGARLEFIWIREKVASLPVENHWHSLAKSRLSDDIHTYQHNIVRDIVKASSTDDADRTISDWMEGNKNGCRILASLIADMKSLNVIDFATLSVAISEVHLLGRKASQSVSA